MDLADGPLDDVRDVATLCEVLDCDLIPQHNVYPLGPYAYAFPNSRLLDEANGFVSPAGQDWPVDQLPGNQSIALGSLAHMDQFRIVTCCSSLFRYYGLDEAVPGHVPGSGRMVVSRFDRPSHDNLVSHRLGGFFGGEFANLVTAEEALAAFPLSYNDDFVIVSARDELNDRTNTRGFGLLSKRPLLHGRHVAIGCSVQCSFTTMAFAGGTISEMDYTGDIGDTRPHIHWYWVPMGLGNMFLCTLEEVENGCDPSIDEFDVVIPFLEALEDMFEAAQVYPQTK